MCDAANAIISRGEIKNPDVTHAVVEFRVGRTRNTSPFMSRHQVYIRDVKNNRDIIIQHARARARIVRMLGARVNCSSRVKLCIRGLTLSILMRHV